MGYNREFSELLGIWYFPVVCLFLVQSVNFFYVVLLGGIKRIDAAFSTPEHMRSDFFMQKAIDSIVIQFSLH